MEIQINFGNIHCAHNLSMSLVCLLGRGKMNRKSYLIPQLSDDKNQKWTFFAVQSDTSVDDSLMSLYLYLSIGISVFSEYYFSWKPLFRRNPHAKLLIFIEFDARIGRNM